MQIFIYLLSNSNKHCYTFLFVKYIWKSITENKNKYCKTIVQTSSFLFIFWSDRDFKAYLECSQAEKKQKEETISDLRHENKVKRISLKDKQNVSSG